MNKRLVSLSQFRLSCALSLCILGGWAVPSFAEGSRDLIVGGGMRPFLEWSQQTTAGIQRSTTWRVYVRAGETVNLGSSVANSYDAGSGAGKTDIVYRSPFGGQNSSCDVLTSGYGYIDTPLKETTSSYIPCSFVATETGIYEVEFHGLEHSSSDVGNPPATAIEVPTSTSTFTFLGNQKQTVGAWDITVKSSSGTVIPGRVFSYYVAMNMGANGRSLNSNFFIQTKDGFRYLTDMNGVDPWGFIFFANSRGYIDQTDNSTLYRTAVASNNNLVFNGNVTVQQPSSTDTATNITHLVFLNRPDTAPLLALGIPLTPAFPDIPQDFKFTGGSGGSGNQTPQGVGGYFSFNASSAGSYQIIIDTNNDGVFDPRTDRILQNPAVAGSNVAFWDGKNAAGVVVPARPGNLPYSAQIVMRGGEYHFPMLDAENNPKGFKIIMENPPGAFPPVLDGNGQPINASTIYYNDTSYTTANGTSINLSGAGAPSPANASSGIDSSGGEHKFNSTYGDFKGIDTWAFFPGQAVTTPLVITTTNQANVSGTKSARFLADLDSDGKVTVGDRVEYTITFSNLSPANTDAINFVLNDTLPSQLTYVPGSATITQTAGNTITLNPAYSGTGSVTNSGTLRVGDTITVKLVATISDANGGSAIANQASANFTTPDNASSVTGTVLSDAVSDNLATNPASVGNLFLQTADDGVNSGNNPNNTADDDPTLITVVAFPKLQLVKRLTAIQSNTLSDYVDVASGVSATHDNAPYWPNPTAVATKSDGTGTTPNFSALLRGIVDSSGIPSAQMPKPNDEVEYTIYFLSDGNKNASSVSLCDFVPADTTYVPNSIKLVIGTNAPIAITDSLLDSDGGHYTSGFPGACTGGTNNGRGAIVVNAGNLPYATGVGTPNASYGYIQFRAKVN